MAADLSPDLALALELADCADAETVRRFGAADLQVRTKADRTPVSDADHAAEQAIRARLAEVRPTDAVVGEEYGDTGTGPRRWIVDPVDGTKNFVRGVPVWASLIALEDAGALSVAVVSAPALGRRWWAARGLGAFADGRPITVSPVATLGDAFLSYGSHKSWPEIGRGAQFAELLDRCGRTRGFGDFWSYMLVAEGVVDIALDPVASLWDLAAMQVIVEEAGGTFTDIGGAARSDGGNAVATNGVLHDEVLRVLSG